MGLEESCCVWKPYRKPFEVFFEYYFLYKRAPTVPEKVQPTSSQKLPTNQRLISTTRSLDYKGQ